MGELLIPFGIHRVTGEIIEPEDAPRGRACDCICPGCKAPLLSRHPKEKRYHFAHDSKHELAKPEEECPFSSAVAVAMMVRKLASQYIGEVFSTPPYGFCEHFPCCSVNEYVVVSQGASNKIEGAETNTKLMGRSIDLKFNIAGHPVYVDLIYKGKPSIFISDSDDQPERFALLELDCDSFSVAKLNENRNIRFSEAVMAFVLSAGMRCWRVHPKAESARVASRKNHHCRKLTSKPASRQIRSIQTISTPVPVVQPKTDHNLGKHYECIICGTFWEYRRSGFRCPKCRTHLYSRESKKV